MFVTIILLTTASASSPSARASVGAFLRRVPGHARVPPARAAAAQAHPARAYPAHLHAER